MQIFNQVWIWFLLFAEITLVKIELLSIIVRFSIKSIKSKSSQKIYVDFGDFSSLINDDGFSISKNQEKVKTRIIKFINLRVQVFFRIFSRFSGLHQVVGGDVISCNIQVRRLLNQIKFSEKTYRLAADAYRHDFKIFLIKSQNSDINEKF